MRNFAKPSSIKRRQHGTALIEFSLCGPLLITLALGTIQFGYSMFVYAQLEQGVRAAARYASVRSYGSSTITPNASYLTAVRNVAVYGSPVAGTEPLVPGLSPGNVNVGITFTNGVPSHVTVDIANYDLPRIIGSIRLTNKPSVRMPYLGIYAPPA